MFKKALIILLFFMILLLVKNVIQTKITESTVERQASLLINKERTTILFKNLNSKLTTIVDSQNPRSALFVLVQKAKINDKIASECHVLAHNIGHEAFKKYKSFEKAMDSNEVCNSGYIHGVIESYFVSSKNSTAFIKSVCQNYKDGSYHGWECYHGVGHGIMFYNNNNLPLSLLSCGELKNSFELSSCINGVFMENFNTDQKLHPSHYLQASNPFYPCKTEAQKYKSDCYLYAPFYYLHLNKNAYVQALKWCKTAEPAFQNSRAAGVGAETIKENINNPITAEHLCMSGTYNQHHSCIQGMVELYINNFGSINQAKSLCERLENENKAICKQTIGRYSGMFNI